MFGIFNSSKWGKVPLILYLIKMCCRQCLFFFLDERNMEGSTIAPNISRKERIDLRLLEGYKKEFRPYVLNPKYSCPTSLPLYFYFGYQLLQETEQMKECGPVRNYFFINNIKTIQS